MKPVQLLGIHWHRVSYAALVFVAAFGKSSSPSWAAVTQGLLVAICLLGYFAVTQMTSRYAIATSTTNYQPLADERQARVRDEARAPGYLYLSVAVIGAMVYMMLAIDSPRSWRPTQFSDWNIMFRGFLLMAGTLPQSLIAWRERDDFQEEPAP